MAESLLEKLLTKQMGMLLDLNNSLISEESMNFWCETMVESRSDDVKATSLTERSISTSEDLRADICIITVFSIAVIW
eukprot:14631282-Ditylum_brightwellii.AAC.1